MAKKILVILGIFGFVGIVVIGVTTCGIMKLTDAWVKEKEPELLQYVQMDEAGKDEYVEKHIDELFRRIDIYAAKNNSEMTAEEKENWKKFENDSEVQAVGLKLGRSLVAALIMSSENILKNLNAEEKVLYEKESSELEIFTEDYKKLMEKYNLKKK